MPRPPLARERVLDAFESLIVNDGERAATLEATAKAAKVSKGGLLYHFCSKDELVAGLLDRLDALTEEDIEQMESSSEGPVAYYVRTSVLQGDALDRALVAVSRLAQSGYAAAAEALRRAHDRWAEALRPHVRDTASLNLVMLLSDGLYVNNSLDLHGPGFLVPRSNQLTELVNLVLQATTRQPAPLTPEPTNPNET